MILLLGHLRVLRINLRSKKKFFFIVLWSSFLCQLTFIRGIVTVGGCALAKKLQNINIQNLVNLCDKMEGKIYPFTTAANLDHYFSHQNVSKFYFGHYFLCVCGSVARILVSEDG